MIVTDDEDGSDLFHDFPPFGVSVSLTPFIPNLPNDPTKLETELRGGRGGGGSCSHFLDSRWKQLSIT